MESTSGVLFSLQLGQMTLTEFFKNTSGGRYFDVLA